MSPHGPPNAQLIVIGEAPGEDEDKLGKPFVGRSGSLLRQVIGELGFDTEKEVLYTNVVRCRPPDNKITKQAIQHCKPFIMEDLESYDHSMIFLMGNTPLNAVLGESGITDWNGTIVKKEDRTFVPLFHPAYILRDMTKMDMWLDAMIKAVDGEESSLGTPRFTRHYPTTIAELSDMREQLNREEWVVCDVETTSLDAFSDFSAVISVAFCAGDHSYSFPLYHPDAEWTDNQLAQAIAITRDILQHHTGKIINHNTKFDLMHLWACLGVWFAIGGDTMLISHLLDSRQGIHGLKRLAGVHVGMYEYDKPLRMWIKDHRESDPERGGSYAMVPLEILLPYGCMDVEAVTLLNEVLLPQLSPKQRILYDELIIPASDFLCRIQCNGMKIDEYLADRYLRIYTTFRDEYFEDVMADEMVQKMCKQTQRHWDKIAQDDLAERLQKNPHARPHKRRIFIFNPNSSLQLQKLYFKYYDIPVLATSEKTKAPSTSAKLYRGLEERHPILRKVRMYKMMCKMINTYLRPALQGDWMSSDKKVHTTINQHGTITGRTSSSEPANMQNIPTPEKEPGTLLEYLPIKNIFTHTEWVEKTPLLGKSLTILNPKDRERTIYEQGALVQWDYSAMEIRVFASCSNCEPMLQILRLGVDPHYSVAALAKRLITRDDLINIDKAQLEEVFHHITKPERYRYKWTNWTLLYGGDAYTLSRTYDIPLDEAEQTVEIYYDIFPEVLDFQNQTIEFAREHGYIESPFGRREWLPYIAEFGRDMEKMRRADERAAVNMPIQSAASDTLLAAGVVLQKDMDALGLRSLLVNTVHDSLVADCPYEEILTVARAGIFVMENIPQLAKVHMPSIDFSWLKAPLKADADVGTHYGTKTDLDKWLEETAYEQAMGTKVQADFRRYVGRYSSRNLRLAA